MKKIIYLFSTALALSLIVQSCKKDSVGMAARTPNLPDEVYKYDQIDAHGNAFVPNGNIAIDNEMATLGRVLFYETQLSINNRVSCGSCHDQSVAFADRAAFSNGFENVKTTRNTPAIINPGSQTSYFWDMRESNLAAMVTQPISNHIEMGLDQPEYLVEKVKKLSYYEPLFVAAFGDAEINISRIGDALSNFVGSMVSVSSKYDQGIQSDFANFTEQEALGKFLFTNSLPCGQCHGGENFSGWGTFTQNIGLEMDYADNGQPGIDWNTGREMDGWFKVPSLRNVALTAPYMHDGRFKTLEEVIDFYDHGIQPHDQLSFSLREGWGGGIFEVFVDTPNGTILPPQSGEGGVTPLRMNLSQEHKDALIAFLKTLSDEELVADVKFSDPFKSN